MFRSCIKECSMFLPEHGNRASILLKLVMSILHNTLLWINFKSIFSISSISGSEQHAVFGAVQLYTCMTTAQRKYFPHTGFNVLYIRPWESKRIHQCDLQVRQDRYVHSILVYHTFISKCGSIYYSSIYVSFSSSLAQSPLSHIHTSNLMRCWLKCFTELE